MPHVLIADDDPEMRAYIRHGLRGTAHVVEAADGAEALSLARRGLPDLVIADIRMPGLDGHALCAALHADAATRDVPVLLVSGEPRREAACADGFLAKPFNAARLRDAVAGLLPPRP
jgi:CheY-like chemotaxis protein